MQVAKYNLDMARWWVKSEPKWHCILNGTCLGSGGRSRADLDAGLGGNYWGELWKLGPKGYWQAWNTWINGEPAITPCLSTLEHNWPSPNSPPQ